MAKRKTICVLLTVSILVAWTLMTSPVLAEEATPPAGAPQATATPAPVPKPDPAGIATGDKSNAIDGAGNSFVVTEPTDKTAPDYAQKLKEFEEYKAQAAKEPLAVKLADTVGHNRIGANFSWTLITGYLVLFMQAGFALLTCGLVRRKNAAHLMMLNFAAYVFAFLAYYVCGYAFQYGAVAINAAPTNIGGTPTLTHFLIGGGQWGFLGGSGFFLGGPAYDAGSNCLTLFEVVFMETAGYIIVGAICERITFWAFVSDGNLHGRHPLSNVRLLGLGWWLALAIGRHLGIGSRVRGFRGLDRCSRGRRFRRDGPRGHPRPSPRQVRPGRQATALSSSQHCLRRDRHFHSSIRLDGV